MSINDLINHWQDIPLWQLILTLFCAGYLIKVCYELLTDKD